MTISTGISLGYFFFVCNGFYLPARLRFYILSHIIDLLKQGTIWWVGYVERIGNLVGNPKEVVKISTKPRIKWKR